MTQVGFHAPKILSLHADNCSNFMAGKMHNDSHKIKKPPTLSPPPPPPPYRKPVIIHTHSPKVIQTEPHNFMRLVQKLTGCDAAHRKRKNRNRKKDQQSSESHISAASGSTSLNKSISDSVGTAGTKGLLNRTSYGYNNQQVSHQMSFMHDSFEENNLANAFYMADNSYASSQCALSSMDLPPQLFNLSSSSQSFRIPSKQPQPPPPPNYVADSIYLKPYQENMHFVDNRPLSSAPAIGEYKFSEFLPQIFAKDFEF